MSFFPVFTKDASHMYFAQVETKSHAVKPMHSYSPIVPAVSDRVQTVQAGAGEVGGGTDVLGDGGGEEVEEGRPGHWTAVMGKDRALVGAAQNMSEWPDEREKAKGNIS